MPRTVKKEKSFEETAMNQLTKLPKSYWATKEYRSSVRGTPDRQGCINGRFIALEFKRSLKEALKNSTTRPMQLHIQNEIQRAGGYSVTVYPENWSRILKELKEMSRV